MSCVTWEPKSRIRMRSCEGAAIASGASAGDASATGESVSSVMVRWPLRAASDLVDAVVGCFLHDLHVVHVRFAHARRGDLDELAARSQLVHRGAAAVAHGCAQAAHELMNHRGKRALVRHASLNTFGNELLGRPFAFRVLEVAIRASLLHCAERAHAAIALVGASL